MKSTTHFAIGHLLFAALQSRGIYLNRVAFVYGCIAPDYDPALLFPTHFTKTCERSIPEIAQELSELPLEDDGRVGAYYSKRLGILCHFLCDYFCRAHNKCFEGGLAQHAGYENRLDMYLRRNWQSLFDIESAALPRRSETVSELTEGVFEQKELYLSAPVCLGSDLEFAFNACLQSICSLAKMSRQNESCRSQLWYEELANQLKGYANGESIVFRMFFHKNRKNNIFFIPHLMPPIV